MSNITSEWLSIIQWLQSHHFIDFYIYAGSDICSIDAHTLGGIDDKGIWFGGSERIY
jgi:hypothetical protein